MKEHVSSILPVMSPKYLLHLSTLTEVPLFATNMFVANDAKPPAEALHTTMQVHLFFPREQAREQRLGELRAMARSITDIKTALVSALDTCPHKQHLSEAAEKTRLLVRKLSEQAEVLVGGMTRDGPLEEGMAKLKHFQEQSQNALDHVKHLTGEL